MSNALEALNSIDAGCDRETWVKVGMGAHAAGLSFDEFYNWSSTSDRCGGLASCRSVWNSIKPGAIGEGTLYHYATASGWKGVKRDFTPDEIKRRAENKAKVFQAAKDKERGYILAAEKATELLRSAKLDTHPYLKSKQLPEHIGLVLPGGELFIPMRDIKNNLVGAQTIQWDAENDCWSKKMLYGMRAKGAMLTIGSRNATGTILVEGHATGLTVMDALRMLRFTHSVTVCFSDRNMVHVAGLLPGKKFIFADNDESGAGLKAATDAGLPYCMSDEVCEDANDLYARAGLMSVAKIITKMLQNSKKSL